MHAFGWVFLSHLEGCDFINFIDKNSLLYIVLEYNIQVLTIEMTGRKPLCIRVQITAVTSAFYFMPVLCVLYSKTLKR